MKTKFSFFAFSLIIAVFCQFLIPGPQSLIAQEKKSADRIREKLKQIKDIKTTTAVAGVRGAEEKDSEELYWAGKDSFSKDEVDLFKSAFEKAEKGEIEKAKSGFEEFLLKYPSSNLAKDAHEMMEQLK